MQFPATVTCFPPCSRNGRGVYLTVTVTCGETVAIRFLAAVYRLHVLLTRVSVSVCNIAGPTTGFTKPIHSQDSSLGGTMLKTTTTLAALATFAAATTASAQVLVDYSGDVAPDFTFGAFDGNVTPGTDGVAVTVAGGADTFGGLGQNTTILANPVGSDADSLELTLQLGANNTSDFVVAVREGTAGEFFSYAVPASSFTTTGFTTVSIPLNSFFFNGDTTDGILNEAIGETSFQSPFGGMEGIDAVVQSITYVPVPEPTSLGLLGLGGLALIRRRR